MGRAQFGVATGDQVIRALEKGSPLCVLAQLFQKSPMCWMYKKDKINIQSLQDLKGKTIGITFGNEDETMMHAILQKAGLKSNDVNFYSVRYDYTPFYTGKVDLWPVYRNSNGVFIQEKLKSANVAIAFFSPHEYGIQFVGNSIVTSQNLATQNPELIQKFGKAILKGWQSALAHQNLKQTVDIIQTFDEATDRELIEKQLIISRLLMQTASKPLGYIDQSAWQQTEQFLLKQKIIQKPVLNQTAIFFSGGQQ
ncbi:MAG: sulfonate/nitrate/taurine transport system substrate-binding protein [Candidatus Magnetoglobus multicellularis str. Araruama]|uniref:Thiamine pyrimidine synthase n=1 Tax=Candidatus Magnetoglobus multicellularis str. Araruama TaxID=890399 RepID=A0A1V1NYQ6_9BACT|nr:MAG: sulfonate/nitrate/taurine transport system substrate-binding protein [Candidatus Magnetoglobus multicellularis str. Araruama]